MGNLIARTPCEGLLPLVVGTCTLSEIMPEAITSIMPEREQSAAVSGAVTAAHGMAFPAAGRATGREGARLIWSGQGQALLVGPPAGTIDGAALTDQSDAWAVMRLEGARSEDVLARLVPVDLRAAAFKRGHTARTMLFHMPLSITRVGANAFELLVFRSMARTAVHELSVALKSVDAQG